MVNTIKHYPLHICDALRDTLLEITSPDDFEAITDEFFKADTLCRFSNSGYLVNIRYFYGCSSAGFCNILFRVSANGVTRLNDIKGYIDSVACDKPGPFMYITLPDADIRLHYRLIYSQKGFRFKNYIGKDSASGNGLVKIAPEKQDSDAYKIDSEIGWNR